MWTRGLLCGLEAYRTLQQDNVRFTAENSKLAGENQSLRSRLQNLETKFDNFKQDIKNEILSEMNNTAGSSISREALRKEISSVILVKGLLSGDFLQKSKKDCYTKPKLELPSER